MLNLGLSEYGGTSFGVNPQLFVVGHLLARTRQLTSEANQGRSVL